MVAQQPNSSIFLKIRKYIIVPLNPIVEWDRYSLRDDDSGSVFGWISRDDGFYDFVAVNFKLLGEDFLIGYNTSSKKYSREIGELLGLGPDNYSECKPAGDILEANLVRWQKIVESSIQ